MHHPMLMVGGEGGGGEDCGGYFPIFLIYISILINYPNCVQCDIINPTTFLFKADFLI